MSRKSLARLYTFILIVVFLMGSAATVSAETASKEIKTTPKIVGKAYLSSKSYFQLKNVVMLPASSGNVLAFTVKLYNGDDKNINFINYWVKVMTKSGDVFTTQIMPDSENVNEIVPKSSQDIHLYARVNSHVKLSELIFHFLKWDFTISNFEKDLGNINIPTSYSPVTIPDEAREISISSVPINVSIASFDNGKNGDSFLPRIKLSMENKGTVGITIPDYHFFIHTGKGYMYPLHSSLQSNTTLYPLQKKSIVLSGNVPSTISDNGWQLFITKSITSGNNSVDVPVGQFKLLKKSTQSNSNAFSGNVFTYSNDSGVYTIKVDSFQRLAWQDQDILAAKITLTNSGSESVVLPNLEGKFNLYGKVPVDTTTVNVDQVVGIPAGSSAHVYVIGKIPYTYQFPTVELRVDEKLSDQTTQPVFDYNSKLDISNLPVIPSNNDYTYTDIGSRSTVKIDQALLFRGIDNNVILGQMDYLNLEKRAKDLKNMIAYFQSQDGKVYPAQIADTAGTINPNGKAAVDFWAKIPKDYKIQDMKLIIGQGVIAGHLANAADTPDNMINGLEFQLPNEKPVLENDLSKIEIFPYELNITSFRPIVAVEGFEFKFEYNMIVNHSYDSVPAPHQLYMTLEDENGNVVVSHTTSFDSSSTGTNDFQEGNNLSTQITMPYPKSFNLSSHFTFKMYDYLQGKKKLLAEIPIKWSDYRIFKNYFTNKY